jgi:hypothetical protein
MSVKEIISLDKLFSFWKDLEKILNQTRWGVSIKHVMGEAKAPVQDLCGRLVAYE